MHNHDAWSFATCLNRRTVLTGAVTAGATAILGGRVDVATAQDKPEITIWLDSFNGGATARCQVDGVLAPYGATGTAVVVPTVQANNWETTRIALSGGGGPDVIAIPGPALALRLAKAGQFLPLDAYVTRERWSDIFMPWALDLGVVDGQLYTLPFEVETLVLYYNKTLFTERGWTAPTTMDELMALAQTISDAGIIPFAHCNQEWRSANEWFVGEFMNQIAGPQKIYQALTGAAKFTDPEFVEAVTTLTTMQQNGWFMGGLDRYYTTTFADANAAFAAGEAAMKIEGTWWLLSIDAFWGPDAGNDNEWDWAPVPSKSGQPTFTLGMASLAVNAKTAHPDEVAQFLTYFFSPDAQATMLTDCLFAPAPVTIPKDKLTGLDSRHAAILAALNEASASNTYGYTTSTFWPPKTESYLIETIEKVWAGDVTAEAYLQGMQAQFDEEKASGEIPTIPAR
jgi:raffinose/stachyose/melibiose transport system substrate-binding protein